MSDTVENKELKTEEIKAEEAKAEETKAEETKPKEAKAEEAKVEEAKAEEAKAEETKAEETKPEEAKSEEVKAEEAKAEETKSEEVKAEEAKSEAAVTAEAEPYVVAAPVKVQKKVPVWAKACMITVAVVAILYFAGVGYFTTHFFWNSTINGVDVSFLDASRAQEAVTEVVNDYQLEIRTRDGETEFISGADINLQVQLDEATVQTIQEQNVWLWFVYGWLEHANTIDSGVTYDVAMLSSQIQNLNCMQKKNIVMPVEPQIVKKGNNYVVEEGNPGKKPIEYTVRKVIKDGVLNLAEYVDLDESGCYAELKYDADDKVIREALEKLNALQELQITYQFQEEEAVLTGSEIQKWIEISGDYEISLNEEDVLDYIEQLKENYEIRGQKVNFHTSYDKTVEITSYIRSNELNTEVEVDALLEAVDSAMNDGKNKFVRDAGDMASVGDTYIEINLTSQHLYCYENGVMIFDTDIVSGRPSTGCATPPGVYSIRAKSSPAILVGATYRQPVSYWMPFNGGIGLHDATWQRAYGGQRYLSNGSHGCINLPLDAAKFIYQHYSAGDYVVLYHLEGTAQAEEVPAARPESSPIYVPVPTTEAPATEAPATEAPATEAPTTEAPTTEAPTTEAPTPTTPDTPPTTPDTPPTTPDTP